MSPSQLQVAFIVVLLWSLSSVSIGRTESISTKQCSKLSAFECDSVSDLKHMRKIPETKSLYVISGIANLSFACHVVENNFLSFNSGRKYSFYRFQGNAGPVGSFNFTFFIGKDGRGTQLLDGATHWTPFAYTYINGYSVVLQCYGEQLQYRDVIVGVRTKQKPTDRIYKRAEHILECLGIHGHYEMYKVPWNEQCK